jgi:uncharacterized paraquat-inducible protein A
MMHDRFRCPACRDALEVMSTAYGERATCSRCDIRWTRILRRFATTPKERDLFRVDDWVAERR